MNKMGKDELNNIIDYVFMFKMDGLLPREAQAVLGRSLKNMEKAKQRLKQIVEAHFEREKAPNPICARCDGWNGEICTVEGECPQRPEQC
jgi:hypothetical protein